MKQNPKFLTFNIVSISIAALLFGYILIRAYLLSITHDESLTLTIVQGDTWRAGTANNHLLNTWLLFGIVPIFGFSEIVLRAPNVLAFILFAAFSIRIIRKENHFSISMFGLVILLLNPYLLDFFSLARGYGLSLAFLMPAIYYTLNSSDNGKAFVRRFQLALLFITLSILANLNVINLGIAIMLSFAVEYFIGRKQGKLLIKPGEWKQLYIPVILFLIIFINIYLRIKKMEHRGELYFGGTEDFYRDTLTRLVHDWLYDSHYGTWFWQTLRAALVLLIIAAVSVAANRRSFSPLMKTTFLLLLVVLASVAQFYLFGTLLPLHRTALVFYPLIALMIFFLVTELFRMLPPARIYRTGAIAVLSILITLPLSMHGISNLNLRKVLEWQYESNTKNVMQRIELYHKQQPSEPKILHITNQWDLEPAMNYYRKLNKMDYIRPLNREGIDLQSDFIYCSVKNAEPALASTKYQVEIEDEISQTMLLKRIDLP